MPGPDIIVITAVERGVCFKGFGGAAAAAVGWLMISAALRTVCKYVHSHTDKRSREKQERVGVRVSVIYASCKGKGQEGGG